MAEVKVIDVGTGNEVGRIWSDGDATIKSAPPALIGLTRQFLGAHEGNAPATVESMRGYSNGYVKIQ